MSAHQEHSPFENVTVTFKQRGQSQWYICNFNILSSAKHPQHGAFNVFCGNDKQRPSSIMRIFTGSCCMSDQIHFWNAVHWNKTGEIWKLQELYHKQTLAKSSRIVSKLNIFQAQVHQLSWSYAGTAVPVPVCLNSTGNAQIKDNLQS